MRDRELERKIELLKEFIEEWVGFRDFLRDALKDKALSAGEEKKFLEIKSQVARKFQGVTRTLGDDFSPDKRLMDIISHAVSLESMAGASDMQFRKIENDWHLSYINLNEFLGNLESKRDRLSKVSGVKVALGRFAGGVREFCRGVAKVVLVLFFLAVIGLVGSFFLPGGKNKDAGLINYLVITVKGVVFEGGESKELSK